MFVAGFNSPGYLPNPDFVFDFDSAEEAWLYLAEEIEADKAELIGYKYDSDSLEAEILAFDTTTLEGRTTTGEIIISHIVFWVTEKED